MPVVQYPIRPALRPVLVSTLFALLLPVLLVTGCVSGGKSDARFELPATDDGLPGAGPVRHADWFQNLWRERRTAFARAASHDQGAVVFLGDSITQGWGDSLDPSFPGLKVANRGISGDTTRGVLFRLQEDVIALRPRGVVLLIGTNDLEDGAPPEMVTSNLKLILAALRRRDPALPVVLCAVFPSSATMKRPADRIQLLNKLYKAAVKDEPQVTFLDTWKLFADAQRDAKLAEFPDLLHPNAAGYAKFAGALRPVLATLGFLETEPDNFTPEPGFTALFNGRDLTGWGYRAEKGLVPAENFNGQPASADGRFLARNGRLVVIASREGREIRKLWTTAEFPRDFELRLEFRATPNADSGIYLRGPQLQCRDYLIAGPYRSLQHYRALDWNEIVVTVKDGIAHSTCNGEVLEKAQKLPASGPIGLESDHDQMEYRRIRIRELP